LTIYPVLANDGVQPGLEHTIERVVDERLITMHVGGKGVFATPAMIGLMEGASHKAVEDRLPEGQTTVGYEVHVRHLAPAPPGSTIVITSRLTAVNGNKLLFEVSCSLGDKLIGTGTHKRAIVPANF
jgi:fluoroacetyl-CoA thioesterase